MKFIVAEFQSSGISYLSYIEEKRKK